MTAVLPAKTTIGGVALSVAGMDEVVGAALALAAARRSGDVFFANAHTVVEARRRPELRAALARAAVVAPDGMSVVWALRSLGFDVRRRAGGPDVMAEVVRRGAGLRVRHYLIGGGPWGAGDGVASRVAARLEAAARGVAIAGVEGPPAAAPTPAELAAIAARIRASGADCVWIGIGSPYQELLMARLGALAPRLYFGVGAAFDFLAGSKRRAPRLLQEAGLEWAFRLAQEPRRLGRRYLISSPQFVRLWLGEIGAASLSRKRLRRSR